MRLAGFASLAAAAILAAAGTAQAGPNLITNGNFSAGLTGFTSDYTVPTDPACIYGQAVDCQGAESTIFVNTDPSLDHTSWSSFGSSPGNGSPNMLLVNGGSDPTQVIWGQGGIAVAQNEVYEFSGAAASSFLGNPGILQLTFNGATVGSAYTINLTPGVWGNFTFDWYSGSATSLDLALFDLETAADGNDFALDDFSLVQVSVPEPASAAALIVGLTIVMVIRRRRRPAATSEA
jgi:hypothetical protein